MFEASDISVSFGGVKACDGISLDVAENEIVGLIGPNGSGKSTFVNAVTGVVPATGRSTLRGAELILGAPRAARQAGIVRTYQTPQTFEALTCIENVLLNSADRSGDSLWGATLGRPAMVRAERARWRRAAESLAFVGLSDLAEKSADGLAYGQQRLLEVARAINGEPDLLMLDEPSAGLNAAETEAFGALLKRIRERGISVLLIDHKIDFIDDMCDRIVVLELGRVVARGAPEEVWADPLVMDAYLGRAHGDD